MTSATPVHRRLLPVLLTSLMVLGGCSFPSVFRIIIHQGNIVSQEMVDKLKPGMTKSQVQFILGRPVMSDTFDQDKWIYLNSMHRSNEQRNQYQLIVYFENDRLVRMSGDFKPSTAMENAVVPDPAADPGGKPGKCRARTFLN